MTALSTTGRNIPSIRPCEVKRLSQSVNPSSPNSCPARTISLGLGNSSGDDDRADSVMYHLDRVCVSVLEIRRDDFNSFQIEDFQEHVSSPSPSPTHPSVAPREPFPPCPRQLLDEPNSTPFRRLDLTPSRPPFIVIVVEARDGGCGLAVKAPDCGSGYRGFESRQPPFPISFR